MTNEQVTYIAGYARQRGDSHPKEGRLGCHEMPLCYSLYIIQCKIYELFIYEMFNLISLEHVWTEATKIFESETEDRRGLYII